MEEVARSDPQATRTLVGRFQKPLADLGLRLLRDRGEAEDLVQETLVRAVHRAGTFKGHGSLRGWLFRIATNLALNRLSRNRPLPPSEGMQCAVDEKAPNPAHSLERAELAQAVRLAVENLPERQRLAVILLRYEGLRYAEIAQALDTTLGAVESLLHRAHETLRKKLKKIAL